MYLVALRTASLLGRTVSLAFPSQQFVREVGLSDVTRKKGLRNLDEMGVLLAEDLPRDDLGEQGQRRRPRKVYGFAPEWAPDVSRSRGDRQ